MSNGPGDKKQLGKILLKQRLVTQAELDELLAEQQTHPGQRLATTAQRAGKVAEVDLLKALSEQHGLPGIDLAQVVVPTENLKLIPEEIAKQHLILPILVKEDRIFLAMADPNDRRVVDEIEFVTARRVFPYVALHEALEAVIGECYSQLQAGEDYYIGPTVPADYLASLGIDAPVGHAPPAASNAKPGATVGGAVNVVEERAEPPTRKSPVVPETDKASEDDLGISQLESQKSTGGLDDAFGSRVAPLPTGTRPRPENPKILVVDDEDDIRKLLMRVLKSKGYEVIEAQKGLEALQKVRDELPDVILLDAMLPEVHGFDICRRIKSSKNYSHIPIIMVSAIYRGWRVAEDLRSSYGVDAFLEKPFKMADVLQHVESALAGGTSAPAEDDMLSKESAQYLEDGMAAYREGDIDTAVAKLREGLGVDSANKDEK